MSRLVLFLGAGYSAKAGLPVMSKFAEASRLTQPNLSRHVTDPDNFRHAAPMLVDARRTFEAFQQFCASSRLPDQYGWTNLESIFSVAEALHQARVPSLVLNRQEYSLGAILRDIQTWIWKTYQQLPSRTLKRDDQPLIDEPYEWLAAAVKAQSVGTVTVITTNYDVVFEYYMHKAGMSAHYPFPYGPGFGAGTAETSWLMPPTTPGFGPCVCKLHGSINYFDRGVEDDDVVYVADDYGGTATIGNSNLKQTYLEEPAILAMDAIWTIRKRYGEDFTPAIVPPTYAKLRSRRWLQSTWRYALNTMAEATTIVFIGYSMPKSDGFMRALLTAAAGLRANKEPFRVVVVDDSAKTHKRLGRVFGRFVETVQPQTFEQATLDGGALRSVFAA